MLDLHSHVLPGLDDGVRTLDESLDLARRAAAQGVTVLAATPHVRDDYPTPPGLMEAALSVVQSALTSEGVGLTLVAGGELDLEWLPRLDDDALRRFSYGGAGHYVLLEFPEGGWPRALDPALARVRSLGMRSVLAHPERNRSVQSRPELLRDVVAGGALVQLTANALTGDAGRSAQAAARTLLRAGLVHTLAGDAHGEHLRGYALEAAAAAVGDDALARYLVEETPRAILAGEQAAAPPRRRRRFSISR